MITEPEMWEEPGPTVPGDLLSGADRPPPSPSPSPEFLSGADRSPSAPGAEKRRRWCWALGGIVAASAVWAGVLNGTGYGRTPPPDVHGYHLGGTPCTSVDLGPLTDALAGGSFGSEPATLRKGPALDHAYCTMTSTSSTGDGWSTWYVITVTVDLHKKTDPRAEFEDTYDRPDATPAMQEISGYFLMPSADATTRPYPGLGDLAYATSGATHQSLAVLHGGAVIHLTVDSGVAWVKADQPPAHPDGSPQRPLLVNTARLAPVLPETVRHLMSVLSR